MAIIIHNISGDGMPDAMAHDYVLRINSRVICRFQHVRCEGLAECLRRAADAVDAADQGKAAYDLAKIAADLFDPFMADNKDA